MLGHRRIDLGLEPMYNLLCRVQLEQSLVQLGAVDLGTVRIELQHRALGDSKQLREGLSYLIVIHHL
ncbi:hypothetical protein D3C81_2231750 [compost metagenome]